MKTVNDRMCAQVDGEAVVFLIGMRFNKPWKIHKLLPVLIAMPKMLWELEKNPDLGFLGYHQWFGRTTMMVQYWRSVEQLNAYAKSRNNAHLPAWAAFNRAIGKSGDVGVWHETYRLKEGSYEAVYVNMPPFGLGKAFQSVPASGKRETAAGRMTPA